MVLLWLAVFKLGVLLAESHSLPWAARPLVYMGMAGIYINIILMVLNLLPLPPLDGGRVVTGLLPGPLAWQFSRIEPFGMPILLLLFFTGILGKLLGPLVWLLIQAVGAVSAVPPQLFANILQSII